MKFISGYNAIFIFFSSYSEKKLSVDFTGNNHNIFVCVKRNAFDPAVIHRSYWNKDSRGLKLYTLGGIFLSHIFHSLYQMQDVIMLLQFCCFLIHL